MHRFLSVSHADVPIHSYGFWHSTEEEERKRWQVKGAHTKMLNSMWFSVIFHTLPLYCLVKETQPYITAHIRMDLVTICVLPPVGSEREGDGVQSLETQRTYGPHYESHGLRNDITSLQECLTQYVVMSAANFTRLRRPDTRSEQTEWHEVRGGGVKRVSHEQKRAELRYIKAKRKDTFR